MYAFHKEIICNSKGTLTKKKEYLGLSFMNKDDESFEESNS